MQHVLFLLKLASEDSTQEEKFRVRFNAMKAGTKLEIEDATGAKLMQILLTLPPKMVVLVVLLELSTAGASSSTDLNTTSPLKISSMNRIVSEDEAGKVDLGGQELNFGAGRSMKIDDDGILELPSNSSIRFGDQSSTKVIAIDGTGNLDLAAGTDIRFGGDASKALKFDNSGNLEVPENAEIRFGSGGTKKLSMDGSNNLLLPDSAEIKIGTKRIKLDTNGEIQVANDGTNLPCSDGIPAVVSIMHLSDHLSLKVTTTQPSTNLSPTLMFRFSAVGSSNYRTVLDCLVQVHADPTLSLYRGFTYDFHNLAGGAHPLRIQSTTGTSGTAYSTGVNGSMTGVQTFTVPMDAPNTLYYQCTIHTNMSGTLDIR